MSAKRDSTKSLKSILKILKLKRPKASCCGYLFFAKEQRKKLRDQYPDDTFDDLSTKLGELWKTLPEEEREYYEEMSLVDKSRFKEEKSLYRQQLYERLLKALQDGTIQPNQIDKSILPTQKQARAPMVFYSRLVRPMLRLQSDAEKNPGIAKPLSVMWNALNEHQRIPFNQMSNEDVGRAREERLLEQEILARLG